MRTLNKEHLENVWLRMKTVGGGQPFGVTGDCDTSTPNDPKMALTTNRPKVSHTPVTPESQISPHFTPRLYNNVQDIGDCSFSH